MANIDFSLVKDKIVKDDINPKPEETFEQRMANLSKLMKYHMRNNPYCVYTEKDVDDTIEALTWLHDNKI